MLRVTPDEFDDLGIKHTLNAHAQVKNFHHIERYNTIIFHDCVDPNESGEQIIESFESNKVR